MRINYLNVKLHMEDIQKNFLFPLPSEKTCGNNYVISLKKNLIQEVEDDLIEIVPESYTKIKNKLAFENFIKTIPKDQNGLKYIEFKVEYCDSTRLFYIQEANISLYDDAITLAIKNVKLFLKVTGTIDGRNEIERSRFIDTILCNIVSTFNREENVKLYLKFVLTSPYGKGRTDFFIKCDDTIVCITEVKRTDLEYGFCQNLIQLQNACKVVKRDQDDIEYVYGIVSTGEKWYFTLVSSDNRESSRKIICCDSFNAYRKITSISENSANKKQRLNELLH
ncbi:5231_t:CDS:2 [Funneliformis caledonium]|uniref:5231_t:CDS:1 n=1 Tax=Funneliformis caledonium TaxID=1117310 RepID=A0A9N9G6J5_9GLOM|nr:5231_t:CDS:2 [Funneliformis caledonium]